MSGRPGPMCGTDLLLRIISRVCEYAWVEPSLHTVAAQYNDAMLIRLYELVVE